MKRPKRRRAKTIGLSVVGVVIAAAFVVLAVEALGGDEEEPSGLLSETELLERVAELDQPVYWVGPYPRTAGYELAVEGDGSIALHYVSDRRGEGEPRDALLVAGYPVPGASEALRDALNSGEGLELTEYGNYEVLSGSPENAYVVYSTAPDLQIEIFSPEPGAAERLAKAGALTPLE